MHRRRFGHIALVGAGLVLPAMLLCAPVRALADASSAYYERSLMTAANQRCGLFTPELGSALASALAQARGAALRSGSSAQNLAELQQHARAKADAVACTSPDIAKAAERVRGAFHGFSQLQRMNYPGDTADWTANRAISRMSAIWRLSQSASFGADRLVFGLAGRDQASALLAVASFADGAQPYAARVIMRDVSLAPAPFLNGLSRGRGPLPLAARTPPRSATRGVLAEARAAADPALAPIGARSAIAFRFPASTAGALADLDPREAVAVEFLFGDGAGEQVRTAYVEVGDFAAGRAFLNLAQR
jgi:hypothetical protein